jgi:hypothetical protein
MEGRFEGGQEPEGVVAPLMGEWMLIDVSRFV